MEVENHPPTPAPSISIVPPRANEPVTSRPIPPQIGLNSSSDLPARAPLRGTEIYKSPIETLRKSKFLNDLKQISHEKLLPGLFLENIGSNVKQALTVNHRIPRLRPQILSTWMPSYSDDTTQWDLFTDEIISNWKNGHFVHIIWNSSQHPLTSMESQEMLEDTAWGQKVKYDKNWVDLIEDAGHLNATWKKHLDDLTIHLKKLQAAGVVVICDLLPYINVGADFWRGRPGVNGSLKLYQLTHDYLVKHQGLNSLVWAWSLVESGNMRNLADYWPGDDYVDVASVYLWNRQGLETFSCKKLLRIVGDKPISMQYTYDVPKPKIFVRQPQWTSFSTLTEDIQLNAKIHSQNHSTARNSESGVEKSYNSSANRWHNAKTRYRLFGDHKPDRENRASGVNAGMFSNFLTTAANAALTYLNIWWGHQLPFRAKVYKNNDYYNNPF